MNNPIITCANVNKHFKGAGGDIPILNDVNLSIEMGESISIVGASGSGKTTLLNLLGGLDTIQSGRIEVAGRNWQELSGNKAAQWRNKNLGFVFQFHLLLPELNVLENVALPLLLRNIKRSEAIAKAHKMLDTLELGTHIYKTPDKISGGERQRVAIGRALIGNPRCIIADEPTGNLDGKNAKNVFDKMLNMIKLEQTSLILVTHDEKLAAKTDRRLTLEYGKLLSL